MAVGNGPQIRPSQLRRRRPNADLRPLLCRAKLIDPRREKSSRLGNAFGVASTRAACAPQKKENPPGREARRINNGKNCDSNYAITRRALQTNASSITPPSTAKPAVAGSGTMVTVNWFAVT